MSDILATLPVDELLDWELSLRESVLAAIDANGGGPFPLQEWIEGRIGGEVLGRANEHSRQLEVRRQEQDYDDEDDDVGDEPLALEGPSRGDRRGGKKHRKRNRPTRERDIRRAQQRRADGRDRGTELSTAGDTSEKVSSWFGRLPAASFTSQEARARTAIIRVCQDFARRRAGQPTLAEVEADLDVQDYIRSLPRYISLQEWMQRRMGGELQIDEDLAFRGLFRVSLLGDASHSLHDGNNGVALARDLIPPAPEFFSQLPADDYVQNEELLRERILDMLVRAPTHALLVVDVMQDIDVDNVIRDWLQPNGVDLIDWINERMGGEVECREDPLQPELVLRKDNFFGKLPLDSFTQEEKVLRRALRRFLKKWSNNSRHPNLSDAGTDKDISAAKRTVFDATGVSLREWIDRRIGGEVETCQDANNQINIGFKGTLRELQPRKRARM
mmetsp:Transcript_53300/g.98551  ORF Transcript_53300/g.98551 Transcript_53300/m.98551 type:complete len:445 (+) Transcript_53300:119-1453(+)